ncbi:hypothetical protein K8R04_02210 [Candidatus Uhrbacteria bacterium]|nr:hypothetical protein [Candidatus Uhrbacteria bacterium]
MKIKQPFNLTRVTRTVYTAYWDEVMAVQDEHWKSRPHDLFSKSYERSQIDMHIPVLEMWREWSKVGVRKRTFPFAYPTLGATEALDIIMRRYKRVHVFKGDYEGFRQLADADDREIITHVRRAEAPAKHSFYENDVFIVSHPSAIDGESWNDLELWLENMRSKYPMVDVVLDCSYLGANKKALAMEIYRHTNVEAVIFSFSKPFGTAFHRIGGIYCRHMNERLEYSRYFKNVPGIALGERLMNAYAVDYIPKRYAALQQAAIDEAKRVGEVPDDAVCSDVIMLARSTTGQKEFERAPGQYRYCLTKAMDLIHHGQILANQP